MPDRDYGWEGWSREPPEGKELPACPECGETMSDLVYLFDGRKPMCEDCYRQEALEHIHDMSTLDLAEFLKDKTILRSNWND